MRIGPAVQSALGVHDIPTKAGTRFTSATDKGIKAVVESLIEEERMKERMEMELMDKRFALQEDIERLKAQLNIT